MCLVYGEHYGPCVLYTKITLILRDMKAYCKGTSNFHSAVLSEQLIE
jgi:hypothetical protein